MIENDIILHLVFLVGKTIVYLKKKEADTGAGLSEFKSWLNQILSKWV